MRVESLDAAVKVNAAYTQPIQKIEATATDKQATQTTQTTEPQQLIQNQLKQAQQDESDSVQAKQVEFIRKAVGKANEAMEYHNRSMKFSIHEKTNEIMVKIIDNETKEVIREIPPEKMQDMFASMLELAGLLVDEKS